MNRNILINIFQNSEIVKCTICEVQAESFAEAELIGFEIAEDICCELNIDHESCLAEIHDLSYEIQ